MKNEKMNGCKKKMRINKGFTLMELMIVVAIVGILAGVGYPGYVKYVIRGKRSEGKATLMDAAARLERFYSDNNRYATAANVLHGDTGISLTSESNYYDITITTAGTFQTYTLNAAPKVPFADAECGTLTLTNAGVKGEGGTSNVAGCWGR